jgi:hypothetical protein
MAPASGFAFALLMIWLCRFNGFVQMSRMNKVVAYCTPEFPIEFCREAVQSHHDAVAALTSDLQTQIRTRLDSQSPERAPASSH